MSDIQYRYLFHTSLNDAATYNIVHPVLIECSIAEINSKKLVTYDEQRFTAAEMPDNIPFVTVIVYNTASKSSQQVKKLLSKELDTNEEDNINYSRNIARALSIGRNTKQMYLNSPQIDSSFVITPLGAAVHTPNGVNFVPYGSIKDEKNNIWTPKGCCYTPGGTCYWPEGTKFTDANTIITPAGTQYTPQGFGYGKTGHLYSPNGTIYSPSGIAYSNKQGIYNWHELNNRNEKIDNNVKKQTDKTNGNSLMYPELAIKSSSKYNSVKVPTTKTYIKQFAPSSPSSIYSKSLGNSSEFVEVFSSAKVDKTSDAKKSLESDEKNKTIKASIRKPSMTTSINILPAKTEKKKQEYDEGGIVDGISTQRQL